MTLQTDKPYARKPDFNFIAEELANYAEQECWVWWRYQFWGGKWNKVTCSPPKPLSRLLDEEGDFDGVGLLIEAEEWIKIGKIEQDKIWKADVKPFFKGLSTADAVISKRPIFDPWERYQVPEFPIEVLPPAVGEFVMAQSVVIGCDPAALAMAVLCNFSAALDHRFRLKMMRNGNWAVHPGLWVILCGEPSRKKTPAINAAMSPLESYENCSRDAYEIEVAALRATGAKDCDLPCPPPRFVAVDTTIEKLAEILARHDRGILVKRDELAGWIGSMEKYTGKGSSADRAFWLQAYDGGSYVVDRVGRGEFRVKNLSASLIGGIQPARLAELHGLTSDGLLQRFLPVMLRPATFPQDVETSSTWGEYARLTSSLISEQPRELTFAGDAVGAMDELRKVIFDIEQVSGSFATGFEGFIGKLSGVAGRLALILQMANDPRARVVTSNVVLHVRRLVEGFVLPHSFEFYRSAETVTDGDRLQKLASYILTSEKKRIVQSDLTTNVAYFRGLTSFEVHQRVSPLVAAGWLDPEKPGPVATSWTVNPAVYEQFAERRKIEDERKQAIARVMGSPRKKRAG